ncbi:hypothetical protein [Veronia nyctiphanis]|uniref:hypothetical protein n=1 Tax=Veronia nyctiphanis TaxID=1278244 RepID=UPI001F33966F|nr:hypothetical protein [Veronia nyctiphanis]
MPHTHFIRLSEWAAQLFPGERYSPAPWSMGQDTADRPTTSKSGWPLDGQRGCAVCRSVRSR